MSTNASIVLAVALFILGSISISLSLSSSRRR